MTNMTNGSEPKKPRTNKIIGTHNGAFHCDEVLACWMLRQLPEYCNSEIIRTRDPEKLSECDIVVDVGAVYDPQTHRYDHHQRDFTGSMQSLAGRKWVTKLSSAGLVFLHFGQEVISELCKVPLSDIKTIELLYEKIYENLIEEVDAIDNGISQYEGEPRYQVTTNLGSRVGNLNPRWNDQNVDVQARFEQAMTVVGAEFMDRLNYIHESWIPARECVQVAFADRFNVHESGEILVFKQAGCPWKAHLFTIEEKQDILGSIKFVLYKEDNSDKWRIQTVPDRLGSFGFRVGLVESWRGIRDDALSKISGIDGGVFVHTSGFIGGNQTYDGALAMSLKSIGEFKKNQP